MVGVPDTAGLRIQATNPKGVYVSSTDPEAAQWYFERCVLQLVLRRKLLDVVYGVHAEPINWPATIHAGHGEICISTIDATTSKEVLRLGYPEILPPCKTLDVKWFSNRQGNEFCLIFDPGARVDGWLVEVLKKAVVL